MYSESIAQVTRMDLPLDWENIFNSDVRTQGVHVDSIADGLILSLAELGRVDTVRLRSKRRTYCEGFYLR